jgi:hypothetical protein
MAGVRILLARDARQRLNVKQDTCVIGTSVSELKTEEWQRLVAFCARQARGKRQETNDPG